MLFYLFLYCFFKKCVLLPKVVWELYLKHSLEFQENIPERVKV